MLKAIVVDEKYGSVSAEELDRVEAAYAKAGIGLLRAHLHTEEGSLRPPGTASPFSAQAIRP
jgi:hypothetical protein